MLHAVFQHTRLRWCGTGGQRVLLTAASALLAALTREVAEPSAYRRIRAQCRSAGAVGPLRVLSGGAVDMLASVPGDVNDELMKAKLLLNLLVHQPDGSQMGSTV